MENKTYSWSLIIVTAAAAILIGTSAEPHHHKHHEQQQQQFSPFQQSQSQPQRLTDSQSSAQTASAASQAASGSAGPDSSTSRYSEPFRAERINRGLSSIFNGVRTGSLEEILRGSFTFTRNQNVRGVADNVLSGVFGTPVRNEGNLDAFGKLYDSNNAGSSASSGSTNARG